MVRPKLFDKSELIRLNKKLLKKAEEIERSIMIDDSRSILFEANEAIKNLKEIKKEAVELSLYI